MSQANRCNLISLIKIVSVGYCLLFAHDNWMALENMEKVNSVIIAMQSLGGTPSD